MIQIVVLFLVAMLVLAIYGRLRPRAGKQRPAKCRKCGAYMIGSDSCKCAKRT